MLLDDLPDMSYGLSISVPSAAAGLDVFGLVGRRNADLSGHHHDVVRVPVDLVDRLGDGLEQPLTVERDSGFEGLGVALFALHVVVGPGV